MIKLKKFQQLFNKKFNIIGMVHIKALPGTPLHCEPIEKIASSAYKETEIYLKNNIDGIIIENMHDVPYIQSKYLGPEITAGMARVATEIKKITEDKIPCGIQVLASGNKEAIAIAKCCNLNFIRSEGFVFSHIADEGFTDANAGHILRYRKQLDAEDVLIFADIKKKHSSHAITSDISLVETAKAAEFFLADGLILTGAATGDPAKIDELKALKSSSKLPILIGSGITLDNVQSYKDADAFIIGSHFKKDGRWENDLDETRIRNFVAKIQSFSKLN